MHGLRVTRTQFLLDLSAHKVCTYTSKQILFDTSAIIGGNNSNNVVIIIRYVHIYKHAATVAGRFFG